MFLNREYIPLNITTKDNQIWCGGRCIYDQIQNEDTYHPVVDQLLTAFRVGDTKHQFIDSFLPLFEMKDAEYYFSTDYVFTDNKPPHVLGVYPDDEVLGLYKHVDKTPGVVPDAYFEKRAQFHLSLLENMDNDNIRIITDILQYVQRLNTLRSTKDEAFKNDMIMFPFTIETKYRVVENVYIPFVLHHFTYCYNENDQNMLKCHYVVHPDFADSKAGVEVLRNGAKSFINSISLNFTDFCTMLEDESTSSIFYVERKSRSLIKKYKQELFTYWEQNPVAITEVEEE